MSTSLPKSSRPSGSVGSPREALRGGALEEAEAGFRASIASAQIPRPTRASPKRPGASATPTPPWLRSRAPTSFTTHAETAPRRLGSRPRSPFVRRSCSGSPPLPAGGSNERAGTWRTRALARARVACVWEGHFALLFHQDFATAARKIDEARGLAARLGLHDVELLSLGLEGVALVSRCEVEEGMRRLDEVTAAAIGGESRGRRRGQRDVLPADGLRARPGLRPRRTVARRRCGSGSRGCGSCRAGCSAATTSSGS